MSSLAFGSALRQVVGVRWVVLALLLGAWATPPAPPQALRGWATYERYCLACHGTNGDGNGPGAPYLWPPPRAFTKGDYKWRSTPAGQPPLRDDVRATIELGAPGTAMPGFAGILPPAQIDELIDVLQAFAPTGFDGHPIVLGEPPPPDPARGAQLFVQKCAACHGPLADGKGGSSFALRSPPYDLRTLLHRPRGDGPDAYRRAAAASIATGLAGTEMPTFFGTLPEADLWALADHVAAIGGHAPRRGIGERAIEADRKAPLAESTWPGSGDPDEVAVFGTPIAPQGPPPAALAPAAASLVARQCARCHAKQYREWETSVHRTSASPGLLAQTEYGMAPAARTACLRCHAPLAEQATDAQLRGDALSCAGCHVRQWTRRGPPRVAGSLIPVAGYPLITTGIYERGDFCLPCHQLAPRDAVAGRPLLDTYREWLEGPYMRRGIQCQHCHMPNREHEWRGVHDRETVRQGIRVTADAHRADGAITAVATLTNIGAGHYLPTTPTPAAWLGIALVDAAGKPIVSATERIGRDVYFDGTWHERADTRIAPGETLTMARAWIAPRAASVRVWVEVHPDAYYEGFYATKLAGTLDPAQRALYEKALARARSSHYTADDRNVPIR